MKFTTLFGLLAIIFFQAKILTASYVFEKWYLAEKLAPLYGCKYATTAVALYCADDMQYYFNCQCEDVVAIGAMSYCAIENNVNLHDFVSNYNDNCVELGYPAFTVDDIKTAYENATKYIKTVEEYGTFNYTTDILRTPIAFEAADYTLGYDTYYYFYQNYSWGIIFGLIFLAFWVLVFVFGGIYQLLFKRLTSNKLVRLHNATWFRLYKQPVSLFGVEWGFLAFNKVETYVVAANIAIFLIGSCIKYHLFEGNFFFTGKASQLSRYVGDRTGFLAMFPFNMCVLFATRNNFLLWCTGWNFASFLNYHKFLARMTIILSCVHGMAYWAYIVQIDYYAESYEDQYFIAGVAAIAIVLVILITASYTFFRKRFYELFLLLHIGLAAGFIVAMWYHLKILEYIQTLLPLIAVWCLDRVLRVFRMFVMFGGYRSNKITVFENENGDKNDIFLRLDVDNYNKKWFNVKDGNIGFVYFQTWYGFWQSHPFTIIKIKEDDSFAFVIKVKKGITSRIYKSIIATGGKSKNFKVCVEGPYGTTKTNLTRQYDNLSVVTVGTGVAGPIGYLNHHRNTEISEEKKNENVLYWGVKSLNVVNAFKKELLTLTNLENKKNIQIIIYCKNYVQRVDTDSTSSKELSSDGKEIVTESKEKSGDDIVVDSLIEELGPNVTINPGYLNSDVCVAKAFQENKSMMLMTCGLPKVCDEARYAFLKNLSKYEKEGSYNFIDESQVW